MYGLAKESMNTKLWTPRVWQSATLTDSVKIPLRKPLSNGWFSVMGDWVVAQAYIVFDAAGTAGNVIAIEYPVMPWTPGGETQPTNPITFVVLGSAVFYHPGSANLDVCVATTPGGTIGANGAVVGTFRAGSTRVASALGITPAVTIAAGDELSLQVAYRGYI
jgi:hypothetical protein